MALFCTVLALFFALFFVWHCFVLFNMALYCIVFVLFLYSYGILLYLYLVLFNMHCFLYCFNNMTLCFSALDILVNHTHEIEQEMVQVPH